MIKIMRGTTKNWESHNIVLGAGQPGYDKNRHKLKIGDGVSDWNNLPYAGGLSEEEVLDSEANARVRRLADKESISIMTYGSDNPDEKTVGKLYLQYYDAEPEVDYVIETGANGIWSYRKWSSGRAECCGTLSVTKSVQTAFDGIELFHSIDSVGDVVYPITFAEIPSELASLQSASGVAWLAGCDKKNSKSNSGKYKIISPDSLANATYYITFNVSGYWK